MCNTGRKTRAVSVKISEGKLDCISDMEMGLVFADKKRNGEADNIVLFNKKSVELIGADKYAGAKADDIFETDSKGRYSFVGSDDTDSDERQLAISAFEFDDYICYIIFDIMELLEKDDMLQKITELNRHLINTFHRYGDETLMIADGSGIIEFAGEKTARDCGVPSNWLIGRSVEEMEKKEIFSPSVTKMVLQTGQPQVVIQQVKAGGDRVSIGMPVIGKSGEIKKVLSITRDYSSQIKISKIIAELQGMAPNLGSKLKPDAESKIHDDMITCNDKMLKTKLLIKMIAPTKATVLITGETGTGKEVVANNIYTFSDRKDRPFIKVNCGAIAHSIIESELFGYEEGSFTGASKGGKKGLIEAANGGTLFLDEISELPIDQQVKLLHVLQEKVLMRVGGTEKVDLDIRVIAATNKRLEEEVKKGIFREDLYYRINVIPIDLPPLRQRKEDISLLTKYFFNRFCGLYNKEMRFSNRAIEVLEKYSWPGNIRELENTIEKLVLTTSNPVITAKDLPEKFADARCSDSVGAVKITEIIKLDDAIKAVEKELIRMAIDEYGTTTRAAEALGINQSTVSRKAAAYNIKGINKNAKNREPIF